MDTRVKILDCRNAAALVDQLRGQQTPVRIVTGYFDVLVADHIRRLREIAVDGARLFVVVLDPPAPLLPARARAEMVAALAMVDYVVPAGGQAAGELLSRFAAGEIVREESADLLRADRLSRHVQSRHKK